MAFYKRLLPQFGMEEVFAGEEMVYHVGARTAIGISKCASEFDQERFNQLRPGLHHLCLRAKKPADVDETYALLKSMDVHIVHGPEEGEWAPGYYSVLFEDPSGTRLEVNYVPGKGLLADEVGFTPGEHYR